MIKYLHGTKELPLDKTGIVKWYVDTLFAVPPNMRGHTGGVMTLSIGAPIVGSTKQKVNTHSSTECKLVGADNLM